MINDTVNQNAAAITFTPNSVLDKLEREEEKKMAGLQQARPEIKQLASYISKCWEAAKDAKKDVDERLLKCLRRRQGEYDSDTLAKIKSYGGSEVFIKLTDIKCHALESWLSDIFLQEERPWTMKPSPIPDLPPEIKTAIQQQTMFELQQELMQQQAMAMAMGPAMSQQDIQDRINKAEKEFLKKLRQEANKETEYMIADLDDELIDGDWYPALAAVIADIATFPTGFLRGPIQRRVRRIRWQQMPGSKSLPVVQEVIEKQYERVSPFDVYPSPGARTLQDGYLCIRHQNTRRDIESMIGVDGFDEQAIRDVLRTYGMKGYQERESPDQDRADLEERSHEVDDPDGTIEAIEFWGPVQGSLLLEWGMTPEQIQDPDIDYDVNCWKIAETIISSRLNPNPLGLREIYGGSFRKIPDSIWGQSVPEVIDDLQDISNSCARAMVNNMGIASGPQIGIMEDAMETDQDTRKIYPLKVWRFMKDELINMNMPPFMFFQPESNVAELMGLEEYISRKADNITGIPAYTYGAETTGGGPTSTASGLSMMMSAASKGIKRVAMNIDSGIIKPSLQGHWNSIAFNEPEKIRGDVVITPRASEYLLQKEVLHVRRLEFLTATNNPTDTQITGLEGRAEVLREVSRDLHLQSADIVPERDEIALNQQQQQLDAIIKNISVGLNIPIEQVSQVALGQGPTKKTNTPKPETIDHAGQPASGGAAAQFREK